jgi:hypothetical protein
MTSKQTIKELMINLAKFDSMKSHMVNAARDIGYKEFLRLSSDSIWIDEIIGFRSDYIYRLRDNYTEESEIIECRVSGGTYYWHHENGTETSGRMSNAINDSRFIGFKYAWRDGDRISSAPRLYYKNGSFCEMQRLEFLEKVEVLTPTHVLFRKVN